ncbi:MAG: nuclease-related domain-containing protein [Thiomicrospira sp.]|jgi:hypothetical protein|nr:nuclease-related domain-containing protein [Thiomicrospira sp.]
MASRELYDEWRQLSTEDKNYARGLWGEYALNKALNKQLGAVRFQKGLLGEHYAFLFDRIEIPSNKDKTTEIDSLLVTQKGVFCIEVKSWSGDAIFGEEDGATWFSAKSNERRGSGVRSHKTGNPFRQNAHHLYHLKKILPDIVAQKATFGFVLALNASPFAIKPANWDGDDIEDLFTSVQDLIEAIKQRPIILSARRVEEIAIRLCDYNYGYTFQALDFMNSDKRLNLFNQLSNNHQVRLSDQFYEIQRMIQQLKDAGVIDKNASITESVSQLNDLVQDYTRRKMSGENNGEEQPSATSQPTAPKKD